MISIWLTVCLTILVALLIFISVTFISIPSPKTLYFMSNIPGPPGYWIFGNSIDMAQLKPDDYLVWLINMVSKYPRMMRLWILGKATVFLRDADDVQVLLSSNELIQKGYEYDLMKPWLQQGLILSAGQKWHTRRKMLTSSFHFKILEGAVPVFNKHCRQLADDLESTKGESVDILEHLSESAMHIICQSAMGVNLSEDANESRIYIDAVKKMSALVLERLLRPWYSREWLYFNVPPGKLYIQIKDYLHEFTNMVIKERKDKYFSNRDQMNESEKSGKVRKAFLDTLLEIDARNPGTLSVSDIREEVDSFMFAGHDTTSTMLNVYFSMIGTYPDIQERVYQELKEIFHDNMDRDIEYSDLAKMSYMDCTIKECMRIMPVVPYISRYLHKDLNLAGGVKVPAGANVVVCPNLLHQNPKYWDEPDKFNPDRFLEDVGRHPFAFIPFSAGPRNCIGQRFAMYELKMTIAYILRKLRVEAQTKHGDYLPGLRLIFFPTKTIYCSFHQR